MALEQTITTEIKNAMKARDKAALRGLRAIKQATLLQQTDGTGKELDAEGEVKMLQKLVKQRKDSLEIYEQQGREDLAVTEREEIEVIERFLPEQLSDEELTKVLSGIVEELGASSMKDMGRVMSVANAKLSGSADGRAIAAKVKELLG